MLAPNGPNTGGIHFSALILAHILFGIMYLLLPLSSSATIGALCPTVTYTARIRSLTSNSPALALSSSFLCFMVAFLLRGFRKTILLSFIAELAFPDFFSSFELLFLAGFDFFSSLYFFFGGGEGLGSRVHIFNERSNLSRVSFNPIMETV